MFWPPFGEPVVRKWCYEYMFSSNQTEVAAVAQSLDMALAYIDARNWTFGNAADATASSALVRVFTDCQGAQEAIKAGLSRSRANARFTNAHTRPFVAAIIGLAHQLRARGVTLEIHWLPRCCTPSHLRADRLAYSWAASNADFSQRSLPRDLRDGIVDKLRAEIMRATAPFIAAAAAAAARSSSPPVPALLPALPPMPTTATTTTTTTMVSRRMARNQGRLAALQRLRSVPAASLTSRQVTQMRGLEGQLRLAGYQV